MLRIIAELEPTRNREKLLARVKKLVANVDAIDIPEVPMGRPIASAPVIAAYLQALYNEIDFIPHVRVIDVNRVGLLSLLAGLHVAGIKEAVLLRGDNPVEGVLVNDVSVEEAAELAKKRLRGKHPELGAMLSMRYPIERIEQRLRAPLKFYTVLRGIEHVDKLKEASKIAHALGKKLYTYVIIASKNNYIQLKTMLGDQPIIPINNVDEAVNTLAPIVDGIILSSPGDPNAIVEAAQRLYRKY